MPFGIEHKRAELIKQAVHEALSILSNSADASDLLPELREQIHTESHYRSLPKEVDSALLSCASKSVGGRLLDAQERSWARRVFWDILAEASNST